MVIEDQEPERELRLRLPESVFVKLVDLDDESMCGKDSLVSDLVERAHAEMMGTRAKQEPLPYDEWNAANPTGKAALNLAHGWDADDIQVGGKGMTLPEVLKAYPEATRTALLRMREAAAHYLEEMRDLINADDFSEIRHHAGHVEFEAKAIGELVLAQWSVLRGEVGEPQRVGIHDLCDQHGAELLDDETEQESP
jgi:hypothetical protein